MYKKCLICGKEFETNSRRLYCSYECQKIAKNNGRNKYSREELNNNIEENCLICGKPFIKNNMTMTKKYCSSECRRKAERLFGSKKQTDLEYKDRTRFGGNKYKVLQRDDYKCQMCDSERQLIVHHKDCSGSLDNPNNDMNNLITLCKSCHIKLHRLYGKDEVTK